MKTVLFGAYGRHNFGDMLLPYVITEIIQREQIDTDIHYCDLVDRDMTDYGGHHVESILNHMHSDTPVNIIHTGGDILSCNLKCAAEFLQCSETEKDMLNVLDNKHPYILNKNLFKKPSLFILNSVGGTNYTNVTNVLMDYYSTRDKHVTSTDARYKLAPDCAVMVKYLFDKVISNRNFTLDYDYIAMQISAANIDRKTYEIISDQLVELYREHQLPVVMFTAGLAPGHDSPRLIKRFIRRYARVPVYYIDVSNIWDICKLISNAKLTISTSLHVRIISSLYNIPRLSINPGIKHKSYIQEWDGNTGMSNPGGIYQYGNIALKNSNKIEDVLVDQYIESAKRWLKLLSAIS